MFGEGFLRNLSLLGEDSEQLGEMFETSCMGPFLERLRMSDAGGYVDCTGFTRHPMLFWKEAMKRLCHGLGTGMMKERSVRELLDRFNLERRRMQKDGWITLKKQNRTFVVGHTLAMFTAEFFPMHPSITLGVRVPFASAAAQEAQPLRLGPWTITVTEVPNAEIGEDGARLLETEAPLDVWAVLRNETMYHLPCPRSSSGLYIDPTARLPSFKGVDVSVVKAMPLVVVAGLGNGDSGEEKLGDIDDVITDYRVKNWPAHLAREETCVRVTLKFTRVKMHVEHE